MTRLQKLGVSERTLRVMHIFLYSSAFSVDGKKLHRIEKGCPQGSTISPLLFIIYFGTLIQELKKILGSE
jgi:hypothetical protein